MVSQDLVQEWFSDFDIETTAVDIDPPYSWGVTTDGNPYRVTLAQRDVSWPCLRMEIRLAVSPQHQEALQAVTDDERDAFVFDLRMALLQQPVGQSMELDDETGLLSIVTLGIMLMEEPITRAGFFRRHHQMQTAGTVVSQMLQRLDRFRSWKV